MPYGLQGISAAGAQATGAQSLTRASTETNVGTKIVQAGCFVTLADGGIEALSTVTDIIAGVVMHTNAQNTYTQNERLSIGHIGAGDGIWCVTEGNVKRGDKVHIRAVAAAGEIAGAVLSAPVATKTIATNLVVLDVQNGLAHITQPVTTAA